MGPIGELQHHSGTPYRHGTHRGRCRVQDGSHRKGTIHLIQNTKSHIILELVSQHSSSEGPSSMAICRGAMAEAINNTSRMQVSYGQWPG